MVRVRMKRILLALLALMPILSSARAEVIKYRLYLKDKVGGSLCPLSQRSLERRERQGIAVDSTDYSVSPVYLQQLADSGYHIDAVSRWLNTAVVSLPDSAGLDAARLLALPFVDRIETAATRLPAGAPAVRKWAERTEETRMAGAMATDDNFRTPVLEVNGQYLYEAGYWGQGMLVAVLDGGFLNADKHPQVGRKVVGWHDLYHPSDTAGVSLFGVQRHGAEVLSVMSADSLSGVWGTAPEADYYLIVTEYNDTESPFELDQWVAGVELADSIGCDLVNSSLGYSRFDDAALDIGKSQLGTGAIPSSAAAEMAADKGMIVVAAAGNERTGIWQTITSPADMPGVVSVGATDAEGNVSTFSSAGWLSPFVKPNVSARGTGAYVIMAETGLPGQANGTSFASPFICGLMASLWSAAPQSTAKQIVRAVYESAVNYATPDSLLGYGFPDFEIACRKVLEQGGESDLEQVGIGQDCRPRDDGETEVCFDLLGRRVADKGGKCHFLIQKGHKIKIIR